MCTLVVKVHTKYVYLNVYLNIRLNPMKYIKVNLQNRDCRNISLSVEENFKFTEITDSKDYKITSNFTMMARVTYQANYKRIQKKKVVEFNKNQTLLQAIDIMIEERAKLTRLLQDGSVARERESIAINTSLNGSSRLNDIFDDYIDGKSRTLKDKTIKTYKGFYNTWIKAVIGNKAIRDITDVELQGIVNRVLKERAPKTAKTLKEVLNPIFKKYRNKGYIQSNPVELLEFKKFDNVKNPTITDTQIKSLYQAIYGYGVEPFRSIFVWLSTGRRVNEVLTLKWEDINLADKEFTIRPDNNKAGKGMTYQLDDDLLYTLDRLEHRAGYLFPAIKHPNKKMHNDTLKRHWKKILDNAGIEHLRIHDLRHIIGLKLVNAGMSLEVIASVLGHTTTAITKRYSKVRQETASKALSEFKSMIKS